MHVEAKSQEAFGRRMAKLRKAVGLTQSDLGNIIGVSNRVICYYERETHYPPTDLLPKIAVALKVSTDVLLGIKSKPEDGDEDRRTIDAKFLKSWRRLPVKDKRNLTKIVESMAAQVNG